MEKYHKVEKENNMTTIKKMIKNFVEKLRNLSISPFITNKSDFL